VDEERVRRVLLPSGEPSSPENKAQFFELYKMMVSSSEALVSRRQGVNTFFLTMNGLLLTAVGLFVRGGSDGQLQAAGILVLCSAWRSLIISFGQLNSGKFAIINTMERDLAASIYAAEWEALERGENSNVYRSFTSREVIVPVAFGAIYTITVILSGAAAVGLWNIRT